jgi:hypothetical protein
MRDFVYNGESLFVDHGYIICDVGGSGEGSITTEANRSYNHSSIQHGLFQPFTYSNYDSVITMDFDIIKNPCETPSQDDARISLDEAREIKRWLERATSKLLYFQHVTPEGTITTEDPDSEIDGIRFFGVFTVTEIWIGSLRIGLRLHFESDAAVGFKDHMEVLGTITDEKMDSFTLNINSDVEGYIYPFMEVTCHGDGDLTLTNEYDLQTTGDYRYTTVRNCVVGEVITFTPRLVITSSVRGRYIYDDFNFNYLRLYSPHTNGASHTNENIIKASLPCTIAVTYEELVKVAI